MCPFIIHYPLIEVDYIVRYITWNKKGKGGILRIKIYLMNVMENIFNYV